MKAVFKVIFIGEGGVGKTSLLKRAMGEKFKPGMQLTVGADFAVRDATVGSWQATLQVWDLGGQLRFRDLVFRYFRGAHLAIAVFDLSSWFSYYKLEEWIANLYQTEGTVPLLFVGNKTDVRAIMPPIPSLIITSEEGQAIAGRYNAPYIEASASTGQGIEDIFTKATQMLAERYPTPPSPLDFLEQSRERNFGVNSPPSF